MVHFKHYQTIVDVGVIAHMPETGELTSLINTTAAPKEGNTYTRDEGI